MAANHRCRVGLVALALAGLPSAGVGADDAAPAALKPVSAWIVDYADDSCALRRTFGSAEQPVWLELRQFSPGDEFLVTVASSTFKSRKRVPKAQFLPDGPIRQDKLTAYGIYGKGVEGVAFPDTLRPAPGRGTPQSLENWQAGEQEARERSITGLSLEDAFDTDFVLQTGELYRPMNAMRACLDDLLASWGVDPAINRTLSRKAQPLDQSRWARPIQSRFPTGLFRIGGSSTVGFRLLIDEAGKVTGCRVQRPVVDESYEKEICGIFEKQAKFSPALDASGNPVKTVYLMGVVYSVG